MGRKQAVVPKDARAQRALDVDEAEPEDLIEVTFTEDEFRTLWDLGVFAMINSIAGVMVDDCEDEKICDVAALAEVATRLRTIRQDADATAATALKSLVLLFEEALVRKTEVHFFF